MPIYEYQCDNCQQLTEAWQSLADSPLTTCQACAGSLKKIISMSSFHLKGGGWYADGYNGSGNQKSCPTATPSCPAKETTPSTSTPESKPACAQGSCSKASATPS